MKSLILSTSLLTIFSMGIFAQRVSPHQIPSVIINKFKRDYPKARDISWKVKGELYQVDFEIGFSTKDYKIIYHPSGDIIKTEQEISSVQLPSTIFQKIKQEFRNYQIKDIKKIVKDRATIFEFEAKSGKTKWEITMDEKGNILNKKRD